MIKFFRKIRQKLLVENRFNKYLLYAIGEIILVVIGILIALQINNWNEDKNEREFEKRMLKELKVALDNDIKTIERNENLVKSWQKSNIYLVKSMETKKQKNLNIDSVKYHLDFIWGIGIAFVSNNGPYEALKSSGLDKIENNDLRQEISKLYSFDLPALDVWINQIIRGSITEKFILFDQLFDVKISLVDNNIEKKLIVKNVDFLSSPIFSDIINKSVGVTDGSLPAFQNARKKMSALSKKIAQKLNQYD